MWQEYVVLAGSIVLTVTLVPTILDENAHVPLSTSVPSVVVLFVQTWAFLSMGLLQTALGTGVGFAVWTLIAVRKGEDAPRNAIRRRLPRPRRCNPTDD